MGASFEISRTSHSSKFFAEIQYRDIFLVYSPNYAHEYIVQILTVYV